MQAAKVAIFFCLAVAAGSGSWYLCVRIPDNQWRRADKAGQDAMNQGRFTEADRQFTTAVEAARYLRGQHLQLARSLGHRAQALVALAKHSDAIALLEQALAIHVKAHGPDHAETVAVREYCTALTKALNQPTKISQPIHDGP